MAIGKWTSAGNGGSLEQVDENYGREKNPQSKTLTRGDLEALIDEGKLVIERRRK